MSRPTFDLLSVLLTALASARAVSGLDCAWLAWVALMPALAVVCRCGCPCAFRLGALAGAVQCVALWYWVPGVTARMVQSSWPGAVFLVGLCLLGTVYSGALYALAAWLARGSGASPCFRRRVGEILSIGCLWVAFEYGHNTVTMLGSSIFPQSMGYSQWAHPAIIQAASLTGVYGVSFLIVIFNAAVVVSVRSRRFAPALCAAGVVLACWLGGYLRLQAASRGGAPARVAILQGNIPALDKFDAAKADALARRYLELGRAAVRAYPDLIVWTESAIPWPLMEDDDLMAAMLRVTQPAGACHILGATRPAAASADTYHNSVLLVRPDGAVTGQYDKRRLLPFVERPLQCAFLPPMGVLHPDKRKYRGGARPPVVDSPVGRIGVMVCNENLYPSVARECVRDGAELLVQLANDVWFAVGTPIQQHFAVTPFRAVETGRDSIVANNSGISAVVDARGRIQVRSPAGQPACLSGTVSRRSDLTFYARYGDVFAWLCSAVAGWAVTARLCRRRLPSCRSS